MKSKVYRVSTNKCGKSNIESSQSDRIGRRRLRGRKSQTRSPSAGSMKIIRQWLEVKLRTLEVGKLKVDSRK